MKLLVLFLSIIMGNVVALAQTDRDYIRRGNRLMKDSLFDKAQVEYQKAIEANRTNAVAYYNLGNSLLLQDKSKEALDAYSNAAKMESDKINRAKSYHNMGVILQSEKQLDKAIEAYKEALRNDPSQDDTRYNYLLCLHQMKNNSSQSQDNQEKDEKGEDKKDEKEQNQQQQKQEQPNNQSDQQKEKPNPESISKENAEQLLKAAMQDEQQTQEKIQKAMQQPNQKRLKKQW